MPDAISINSRWATALERNHHGQPLGNLLNVAHALRHSPAWQGVLGFNLSAFEATVLKQPPWEDRIRSRYPARWSDADDVCAAMWMQNERMSVSKQTVGQTIQVVARDHPFHPIKDHLEALEWDGEKRLEVLPDYFGANDDKYTKAVFRKFLIGAVARVYEPGCKMDSCLVLEGEQGIKKSMALRILAGNDEWFSDDMPDLASKDAKAHTRGFWIIELAELYTLMRAEVPLAKAFLSRQRDDVRLPYDERVTKLPRECVFVGTVNERQYLRDATGARRFWPVECTAIAIEPLQKYRDQIIAEAVYEYKQWKAGSAKLEAPWWFEDEGFLADEQAKRFESGVIEEQIEAYLAKKAEKSDPTVTLTEINETCLHLASSQWQRHEKQIGRALRHFKWVRFQRRVKGSQRREWCYRPEGFAESVTC